MDLKKRFSAYLYLVNPSMPFPYYPSLGLQNTDKEDRKIIENIASFYNLGKLPKSRRFGDLIDNLTNIIPYIKCDNITNKNTVLRGSFPNIRFSFISEQILLQFAHKM